VKPTTAIIFLLAALVLLLAIYLHNSAHRYDVVVAAAGTGGSQENVGSTETVAYLVDHKTGRVWQLEGQAQKPMLIVPCPSGANIKEAERGCKLEIAPTKP
jgi:hypothetical protein